MPPRHKPTHFLWLGPLGLVGFLWTTLCCVTSKKSCVNSLITMGPPWIQCLTAVHTQPVCWQAAAHTQECTHIQCNHRIRDKSHIINFKLETFACWPVINTAYHWNSEHKGPFCIGSHKRVRVIFHRNWKQRVETVISESNSGELY